MTDVIRPLTLVVQLAYLGMSMFWNLIGVGLIDAGMRALGPTASFETVGILFIFAVALWFTHGRQKHIYLILSLIVGLAATWTIYGSFTGAPDLWPSEYFRWFGALINVLGVISALLAIVSFQNRKR